MRVLDLKDVPVDEFLLGYFEPGHSFQVPLSSDDELTLNTIKGEALICG